MEHKAYFKNKTGSNAVTTHSDTKRNIPGGLSFAITACKGSEDRISVFGKEMPDQVHHGQLHSYAREHVAYLWQTEKYKTCTHVKYGVYIYQRLFTFFSE